MIGDLNSARAVFAVCQWTDSWLLSVINRVYFEKLADGTLNDLDNLLRACLVEFVTGRKQLTSLVKRHEQYKVIDDEVVAALSCNHIKGLLYSLPPTETDDFTDLLNFIVRPKGRGPFRGFATVGLGDAISRCYPQYSKTYKELPKKLETASLFIEMNPIRTGFDKNKPVFLYNDEGKVSRFEECSSVEHALSIEIHGLPWFYAFTTEIVKDKEPELRRLGTALGADVKKLVIEILEKKAGSIQKM